MENIALPARGGGEAGAEEGVGWWGWVEGERKREWNDVEGEQKREQALAAA